MNLLDSIVGALNNQAGGSAGTGQVNVLGMVMDLLNHPDIGGVGGLLQKMSAGGLSQQVASWVSTGANLPISADQIQSVLGSSFVQDIASKFGLNVNDVAGGLANFLPVVVDKLTPDGQMPDNSSGLLEQGLAGLIGMLGNQNA